MANNLYESNIRKLIKTIDFCFKDKELLAGLILCYSVIDIMAWLSRDPHDADATKSDFSRWVEEFLLPGSSLKCNSAELYAARCAIINAYAPEWGASIISKGEANNIAYAWGKASGDKVERPENRSSKEFATVILYVDDLAYALKVAIQRFEDSLSYNRSLYELIDERSKKYFVNVTKAK